MIKKEKDKNSIDKIEKIRKDYDETSFFYDSRYRKIQYQKYGFILSKLINTFSIKEKNILSISNLLLDYGGGTGLLFDFLNDLQYLLSQLNINNTNKDYLEKNPLQINEELLPFLLLSINKLKFDDLSEINASITIPNMLICDISFQMLHKCIDRNKIQNKEKIYANFNSKMMNLIQCDGQNLPFRQKTFDSLFSFTVMQNLQNKPKGYNEINRVLREDGSLGISILKKSNDKLAIISEISEYITNFRSILDDEMVNSMKNILTILEKGLGSYYGPDFILNMKNNIEDFFFYKMSNITKI